MRPIGMPATIWAMACFGSGAKIGVSIVPGTDDVGADLAILEFQRPGADKRADGRLTGRVDAERGDAFDAGD